MSTLSQNQNFLTAVSLHIPWGVLSRNTFAAQEFIADPARYALDREQKEFLKGRTFYGNEIVPATDRKSVV